MPQPSRPFSDALGELLSQYSETPLEELITELELQVDALTEELEGKDSSDEGADKET